MNSTLLRSLYDFDLLSRARFRFQRTWTGCGRSGPLTKFYYSPWCQLDLCGVWRKSPSRRRGGGYRSNRREAPGRGPAQAELGRGTLV